MRTLHRSAPLIVLLLVVGAFQLATMPRFFYAGDNFVSRAEAAHWLTTGELGISYSEKARYATLLDQRGHYFYANDQRQRLFSKHGLGNTLSYLPALVATKWLRGTVDALEWTPLQMLFINLVQVALSLGVAAYLYAIALLYSRRRGLAVAFVLLSVYTTFLWHYLRAPTHEIYQVMPFLGAYYHFARFLRGRGQAAARPWAQLGLAATYLGYLLLLKVTFVLVMACMVGVGLFSGPPASPAVARLTQNLGPDRGKWVAWAGAPLLPFVAILLFSNFWKFGSPLAFGYDQWVDAAGLPYNHFRPGNYPPALLGFFVRPGNANAFIHYPLFAFGLAGMACFFRRHFLEATCVAVLFGTNLALIGAYSYWNGEWCYGPRYLLLFLIIGSIPAILAAERMAAAQGALTRLLAGAVIAVVLGWSAYMQFNMNALDYFAYYRVRNLFDGLGAASISTYLDGRTAFHRGYLHEDLIDYRDHGAKFRPLAILSESVPPQELGIQGQRIKGELIWRAENELYLVGRPNFLLFD